MLLSVFTHTQCRPSDIKPTIYMNQDWLFLRMGSSGANVGGIKKMYLKISSAKNVDTLVQSSID